MLEVQFHPFTTLNTERLVLREITHNDAQQLFKLRSDANAMFYLDRPCAKSIDDALALINAMDGIFKTNDGISWAITLKGENKLIGTVGFYRLKKEHHRAEIGYMLLPEYWRKGIATEACLAVLDYGFNTINFHSIEADINPDNIASKAILEKLGFIKEAHFKESYFYDGKFLDSAIYSKLTPKKN